MRAQVAGGLNANRYHVSTCLNTFGTEPCDDTEIRAPTIQAPAGMETGETGECQASATMAEFTHAASLIASGW